MTTTAATAVLFQCNNYMKCRQKIDGPCCLTNCFHIFCLSCAATISGQCPACGASGIRATSFSLGAKGRNDAVKLIGCDVDEIMNAAFTGLNFLKIQKECEYRLHLAKLTGYKKMYEENKAGLEADKKENAELIEKYKKLLEDNHVLSGNKKTGISKSNNGIGEHSDQDDDLTKELFSENFNIFGN